MGFQNYASKEKAKEQSRIAIEEHQQREELFRKEQKKRARKNKIIISAATAIIIILASALAFYSLAPGRYDDFAKCLSEKGAVMYGEDWCPYTQGQKRMFGKSFKYINYQVKENLKLRPTWAIDGQTYEKVQSFERLSALTGCKF